MTSRDLERPTAQWRAACARTLILVSGQFSPPPPASLDMPVPLPSPTDRRRPRNSVYPVPALLGSICLLERFLRLSLALTQPSNDRRDIARVKPNLTISLLVPAPLPDHDHMIAGHINGRVTSTALFEVPARSLGSTTIRGTRHRGIVDTTSAIGSRFLSHCLCLQTKVCEQCTRFFGSVTQGVKQIILILFLARMVGIVTPICQWYQQNRDLAGSIRQRAIASWLDIVPSPVRPPSDQPNPRTLAALGDYFFA